MSTESKSSALGQFGPIMAPLIGVIVAVALVVAVVMTGDVSTKRDQLTNQINRTTAQRGSTQVQADTDVFPELDGLQFGREDAPATPDTSVLRNYGAFPMNWDVRITPPAGTDPDPTENGDDTPDYAAEFAALDTNDSGYLEAPGNITQEQLDAWDFNGDGRVSPDEYRRYRTEGPVERFNLAAPGQVSVALDPNTMQVVVAWGTPVAEDLPGDLAYLIERRAPETVDARRQAHRQALLSFTEAELAFNSELEAWLRQPHEGSDQTRRQAIPRARWEAEFEAATGMIRPVAPVEPSEWETVTTTPVTGNEYRDTTFQFDTTYVYSVRAVTQSRLYRGNTAHTDVLPDYSASDRRIQLGRPVYLQNRIAMNYMNVAGQTATIRLTQWLRHENEGTVSWFRISVDERVNVDQDITLGGNYTLAQLQERSVAVRSAIGQEVDVNDVVAADRQVDFSTGFEYRGQAQGNMILNSREYGDFALPRATRDAAAVQTDSAGMANPVEVVIRAIGVNGSDAFVVSTRWLAVDGEWYRVVLQQRVSRGSEVGRNVRLGGISDGGDVRVYNSRGEAVPASTLRGELLRDQQVDLSAGTLDGLTGRVVTIGGQEVDLFGVLYIE
jgi:hypothetical protein